MSDRLQRVGYIGSLLVVALGASTVALGISTMADAGAVGAQATGSVELVAQSAWVSDGDVFEFQVRVAGASPDAGVFVRIHPPVGSRSVFLAGVSPESVPLLEIGPIPLTELQATSNEILPLELTVAGPDTELEPDQASEDDGGPSEPTPVLRTEGGSAVFPVEILLQDGSGDVADSVITHLIELPRRSQGQPFHVVVVMPVELDSGISPDGFFALDSNAGAALPNVIDAMEIHEATSVALDIAPAALAALQRSSAPLHVEISTGLAAQLEPDELFATSYIRLDEQSWLDADLDPELAELYEQGATTAREFVGGAPSASVALLDPSLTDEGLDWLVDQGVQGVLVQSDHVAPLDSEVFNRSLTRSFLIPTESGQTVPALQIDRQLSSHFSETGSAVLNANSMLADLVLLALDDPSLRRSAVVSAPAEWVPNLSFLNVLLSGIERIPILSPSTPAQALARTELAPAAGTGTISSPLRRELRPLPPPRLGAYRTQYNQARSAIDSWATVVRADPDSTNRLYELLRESAASSHSPDVRFDYIDTVYRLIDEQKQRALVSPASETITLTGRETKIPIVIENRLSVDLAVVLLFDSEKLAFPDGKELPQTLAPGLNRIEVPIEALASGDSPIRVQILSPDREILLGSSEVVVRTFAFSGVGLVIGSAAIFVLVIWWLRHRRSRRGTLSPAMAA